MTLLVVARADMFRRPVSERCSGQWCSCTDCRDMPVWCVAYHSVSATDGPPFNTGWRALCDDHYAELLKERRLKVDWATILWLRDVQDYPEPLSVRAEEACQGNKSRISRFIYEKEGE